MQFVVCSGTGEVKNRELSVGFILKKKKKKKKRVKGGVTVTKKTTTTLTSDQGGLESMRLFFVTPRCLGVAARTRGKIYTGTQGRITIELNFRSNNKHFIYCKISIYNIFLI